MRYSNTGKNKETGVVYTPTEMADYVAKEMLKYRNFEFSSEVCILDPAVGEGKLLDALINAIKEENVDVKIKAVGYETDEIIGKETQIRLLNKFPDVKTKIHIADFIEAIENNDVDKYDLVIANPPYIRTQILGSRMSQKIAKKLDLDGRIDIYYAFLLYTKSVLKSNGVAGYITSNKFMTIKAGISVRNYMLANYLMHHITDLGDTKLFTAAVLPCILIFSLGRTLNRDKVTFTSVYEEVSCTSNLKQIENIFDCIYENGIFELPNHKTYKYQQGKIQSIEIGSLWTIASVENEKWIQSVESKKWITFSAIGKIRVGIKTTADNVFIGDEWIGDKADLELLKPLITHRNAGQITASKKSQWKVLYTHKTENGQKIAIDLDHYPKSKAYLLKHYTQLYGRHYVKKANRNWYEIWVPQNPDSWKYRKIVFRDISKQPQFWLDETGAIVNGDCYWIDINTNVTYDVVYLALAVANSKFIEKYYDIKFNTKLYSGKRRYQTQYVEQFPIPHCGSVLADEAIFLVKKIISEDNIDIVLRYKEELDIIVEKLFS